MTDTPKRGAETPWSCPSTIDRRGFIRKSGVVLGNIAAVSLLGRSSLVRAAEAGDRMKKAVGWGMIVENLSIEDKLRLAKDVGFEGVEVSRHTSPENSVEPQALARASEKVGIPIHGVVNGSHPDLQAAIEEAAVYAATSVLHVVRTDPQSSYLENYRRTQELIRGAIPDAEKKRINILIENVWATFLIEPLTMARYVDELGSPFVKSYFDVGNVMRWGYPQHWIEVLGKRIDKIHIKEYSLKTGMSQGMGKGFDFPLGEGDIDWKRVRDQLGSIQFRSWATVEMRGGDRQALADISARMDRVLVG
ncbi:MAG: sugar phosphate isomerase/epimerase [Acidobacteria bacterium]|nr:MAG: sugar phosphate isomerase/epimerase [Acidobacteriota bacterium]